MVGLTDSMLIISNNNAPATSEYIKQAEFALSIKRLTLPLYEQMFDVEYPLPKLDTLIVMSFFQLSFRYTHLWF